MAVVINGTSGITNPNGTAGTPAFTGQGSNTGLYFPTNTSVGLATGGVGRVIADSNGNVTTPSQPAFHVRVNSAAYISTSPVPFSNAVFNTGSHYNTSTFRFTAPVAGKYYFVVNMYLQLTNNEDGYPRYKVNGGNRNYSYAYNLGTGGQIDVTVALNAIFDLSVGDYVEVDFLSTTGGLYYGGNGETNYFGYLLG